MNKEASKNQKALAGATAKARSSNQLIKEGKDFMNTSTNTKIVNFHGSELLTAIHNNEPHVSVKSVSEGLGLDWSAQRRKIKKNMKKFGCGHMPIPSKGGLQETVVVPVRKLNGWLFSINPEKVRADLREKVIAYQEECFAVLHDYWTKGEVINPRFSSKGDRTPLKNAINMLVGKTTNLNYADAYSLIHQRFVVNSVEELTIEQIPLAVEYVHKVILEGQLMDDIPQFSTPVIGTVDPLGMEDLPPGRYLVARIEGKTIVQRLEQHAIVPLDHVNALRRDMNLYMQYGTELLSRMRILYGETNLDRFAEPLIR